MPQLRAEEVMGWSPDRLTKEYSERLDRVKSIRDGAGGSLANVGGDQADEVRNLMADTNLLGERLDEVSAMKKADGEFEERHRSRITPAVSPFPLDSKGAPANGDGQPGDLGGRFLASDAWKAFRQDGAKGLAASLPLGSLWAGYRGIGEVPSPSAATFTTADFPSAEDFRPAPVEQLYQTNNIGPLMAQGTTNAATLRYPVETVTATGAAAVAEGAAKPEAALSFAPVDEPVRKIAVWLPVTDEIMEDEAFLRAYINARLGVFVRNEEDRQLLIGTGTAPEIRGITNRSGINAATSYSLGGANPDQALIDSVFSATMRVRESFLAPDAAVMRAATWETARLAKDANRQYLLGPPADEAALRLWGVRVVLNENMPAKVAGNRPVLVGAFQAAAMVVRRSGIDLAVSDSHASFFVENKLAIRAEERVALAVFRPAGFAVVTSAV